MEFFFWYLPPRANQPRAKPYLSRWMMTREETEKHHPGATPQLASRVVRSMPETEEESSAATYRNTTGAVNASSLPREKLATACLSTPP